MKKLFQSETVFHGFQVCMHAFTLTLIHFFQSNSVQNEFFRTVGAETNKNCYD